MEDLARTRDDLVARRDAMNDAIAAIDRLLGLDGAEARGTTPAGVYTGMTVIEAAKKFLKIVNRPASTKEIVMALEQGGLRHNSKDFYSSVYAIMRQRQQSHKDVKRVASDWALAEETGTP
jgi:hypothetical protein